MRYLPSFTKHIQIPFKSSSLSLVLNVILYSPFIIVISHRYPPLIGTYINELLPNTYNEPFSGIYSSSTIIAITLYLCGSTMYIQVGSIVTETIKKSLNAQKEK